MRSITKVTRVEMKLVCSVTCEDRWTVCFKAILSEIIIPGSLVILY